jgi:LmbE family N-acetylglucosaminyl deacetylase
MKVLVVAPHSDDECLGAGATIAQLSASGASVTVLTVCSELEPVFPAGDKAMVQAEARRAHKILGVAESIFLDYPTTGVNQVPVAELNARVQSVVDELEPDMAFLPFPDRHIDHRVAFESGVVATRPFRKGRNVRLTAMYETISETYWNVPGAEPSFTPHWTVDITDSVQTKIDAFDQMPSRHAPFPGPRSRDALLGLAQFRGSQASCGYGEAFQLIRTSLSPVELSRVLG